MRRGQLQIQFSSDGSTAGRINSRLQIQALRHQRMRGPRGQLEGQALEMAMSGGDAVVRPPHGDATEMPLQGKDALHLLEDADVAHPLPHDVVDPPLLLDGGLLHHPHVDDLHLLDGTLLLSSVVTAPLLCLLRKGSCLVLPQNVPLQGPSGAFPGPPSAGVLLLRRDAHPPPPYLLPDTGGAPCCLQSGQVGTHDPLLQLPVASPHRLLTAPALLDVLPVHRDILRLSVHLRPTSGGSSPRPALADPSAECLGPQSHATTRDPRRAPSL